MNPRTDIPEPWRTAMEKQGMYSARDLAQRTGIGTSTATGLIYGDRRTNENTLKTVADALRTEVTIVREWAATARGESRPWEPPAVANQMSERQRRAIDELIRAMVAPVEGAEDVAGSDEPEKVVQLRVDLARPPLPDLSRVAARRGESEGRRLREEQDQTDDESDHTDG